MIEFESLNFDATSIAFDDETRADVKGNVVAVFGFVDNGVSNGKDISFDAFFDCLVVTFGGCTDRSSYLLLFRWAFDQTRYGVARNFFNFCP